MGRNGRVHNLLDHLHAERLAVRVPDLGGQELGPELVELAAVGGLLRPRDELRDTADALECLEQCRLDRSGVLVRRALLPAATPLARFGTAARHVTTSAYFSHSLTPPYYPRPRSVSLLHNSAQLLH